MKFQIKWEVDDERWLDARAISEQEIAGGAVDQALEVLDELLPGWIFFQRGGAAIVPERVSQFDLLDFSRHGTSCIPRPDDPRQIPLFQGYSVWVAQLAIHLAHALVGDGFDTAAEDADAWYDMFDEDLVLRFRKTGPSVFILSNQLWDYGWMLAISTDEFFAGVRQFLADFGRTMSHRAPAFLSWSTFAHLRTFIDTFDESESERVNTLRNDETPIGLP